MRTTETMKLCDWTGTSRTESDILGTTRKESKWKKNDWRIFSRGH